MKVALYYSSIYLKGGIEKVILETIKRSRHQWTIYTSHYDSANTYADFKNYEVIELAKIPVTRDICSVLKAAFIILRQKIDLEKFDVLMVHTDGLSDFINFRNNNKPLVCFCHTPLRILFDKDYRSTYLANKGIGVHIFLGLFSWPFRLASKFVWNRYSFVVANSGEVKKRILEGGLWSAEKLRILHPGIDFRAIKPSYVYEKYYLVPGRIMWTKNIELAIEAFILFVKNQKGLDGFKLIVAGSLHFKNHAYYEKLIDLSRQANGRIEFRINISDEEYYRLFDRCYAVIFPSFNEDWGIIPIEAMAYAKPVIAVKGGGPKESIEDKITGYLCENDSSIFAHRIENLAGNSQLAREMGKNGRERSQKYDWEIFVENIDALVQEIGTEKG
jgi:glycosyltransferase involved in cell wall biosynthesis